MVDLDFEESEDGDVLWIYFFYYFYWYEYGFEILVFVVFKFCMRIGDVVFGGDGVNLFEYLEVVVFLFLVVWGS